MTKPRAYSYIRMSSSQQIKGDSLRRQLEMSRAFAHSHGLELDDRLRDIGVSAWKGDNRKKGALGEFLNLVNAGRIQSGSYLLIESLDRLSRDQVVEALSLFLELLRAGIVIVTMADGQTYSHDSVGTDWTKLIISLTIMARAHEESARKSQRVKAAFENKRQMIREGRKTLAPSLPAWIDQHKTPKGEVNFVLNEHAQTVRRIFEMAAIGMGQRQIARRLNEEGHPTFRQSTPGWHQPTIASILDNVAVIGSCQPDKAHRDLPDVTEVISDYFPAAVETDLYEKAQRMRRQRPSSGRKGNTFSNLFTGMVVCEHCFGAMAIKIGGYAKRPTKYLQCYNHQRRLGCQQGNRSFRYQDFEDVVLDNLTEYAHSDLFHNRALEQEAAGLRNRIEQLPDRIRELNIANENLVEVLEKVGASNADKVIARMDANSAEQTGLQSELEILRDELSAMEARGHDSASVLSQLRDDRRIWPTLTDSDQYDARLRLHKALRAYVSFISFDSIEQTFTVVLFGGLRAYKFPNRENVRSANYRAGDIKPMIVDMTRLLQEVPLAKTLADGRIIERSSEAIANVEKASKLPLSGDLRVVNDKQVRARQRIAKL